MYFQVMATGCDVFGHINVCVHECVMVYPNVVLRNSMTVCIVCIPSVVNTLLVFSVGGINCGYQG